MIITKKLCSPRLWRACQKLNITTLAQLERAVENGDIRTVRQCGAGTEAEAERVLWLVKLNEL